MTTDRFITEANIGQQLAALNRKEVTATKLVQAYLDRIQAYDQQGPSLNSLIRLNPYALEQAELLDKQHQQGQPMRPLHGIAVLIKDNYLSHDMPTSAGNVHLASLTTSYDAAQVQALRQAGAIILGKTSLHELSSGITNVASISGITKNALNWMHVPGGSSGGSAVAVAASFCAFSLGSDTSGSLRIPAAFHGLYGLRPTTGRFSTQGVVPLCPSFDTVGPIARCPEDVARVLDVMALTGEQCVAKYQQYLHATDFSTLRFGIVAELYQHCDPLVGQVIERTLHTFTQMGATVISIQIPELKALLAVSNLSDLECADALQQFFTQHSAPLHSLKHLQAIGGYHTAQQTLFKRRAQTHSTTAKADMEAATQRLKKLVNSLMREQGLNALIYPSSQLLPTSLGRAQTGTNGLLSAISTGPAITLPIGLSTDGSAIGLELLGQPYQEQDLLNIAQAWHLHHPLFFLGNTFLPPLSSPSFEKRYKLAAGSCTVEVLCRIERNKARLMFTMHFIETCGDAAAALNLEIYENGSWLALDNLYTPYRKTTPRHHQLNPYTWQALLEQRLRLRAFSNQACLGGIPVLLLPPTLA